MHVQHRGRLGEGHRGGALSAAGESARAPTSASEQPTATSNETAEAELSPKVGAAAAADTAGTMKRTVEEASLPGNLQWANL